MDFRGENKAFVQAKIRALNFLIAKEKDPVALTRMKWFLAKRELQLSYITHPSGPTPLKGENILAGDNWAEMRDPLVEAVTVAKKEYDAAMQGSFVDKFVRTSTH